MLLPSRPRARVPRALPGPSALSALLAERYEYLTRGFINYRGPGPLEDFELFGLFESERSVFAILATRDASISYPARFLALSREENRRLTGQTDLTLCRAWPQPSVTVAFSKAQSESLGRTVGSDRPAKPTDVVLKRVGFAQLWWPATGGEAGEGENKRRPSVIWEAFLDIQKEELLQWLWDTCEAFLSEHTGSGRALTPARDPNYETGRYRCFLRGRGYEEAPEGMSSTGPPRPEAAQPWASKTL